MTDKELDEALIAGDISLKRVIDSLIRVSGCIGVGLITLGDNLRYYVHYNKDVKVDYEPSENFLGFITKRFNN